MNFVLFWGQLGQATGSLFFGRMCDRVGCKLPMQICVFMGIFGYLLMYAAGIWAESYWLFSIGILVNGFFGNTMPVASTYFGQLFADDHAKRDLYVGITLGLGLIGGAVGSLIVMPFANNPSNGENFFNAMWLAVGLTVFSFVLVTFVLVPPETTEKEKAVEASTPKLAKRILIMTAIAASFDAAGDEGTRMARGTILASLYPSWSTTAMQNYLLLALLGVFLCAAILLGVGQKKASLPVLCVIGTVATLAVQLILLFPFGAKSQGDSVDEDWAFLLAWHFGKLFGFLSTLGSGYIMQNIAPKELLGFWNGVNEGMQNLLVGVCPLIFASVYDAFGNARGQEMLACTAAVSLLAVIAYAVIVPLYPRKKKEKEEPLELKDLTAYDQMDDLEWAHLPHEEQDRVTLAFIEAGKPPRLVSWGDYARERPTLDALQANAARDFKYQSAQLTTMLTNREELLKAQKMFGQFLEMTPKVDREQAKKEMGAWIADYFDDAGYIGWEQQCTLYKSMLMEAFPPIDPLDDAKPQYESMSIPEFEDKLIKFMSVMDSHLSMENKKLLNAKISAGLFSGIFRRR